MNRRLSSAILRTLGPLDRFIRTVNGKRDLPPLHLRWEVGPLRGFESSAAEYRVFLRLFGGLRAESRVLDIGCGCGQIALELRDMLGKEGAYLGCDIHPGLIAWSRSAIESVDRRFTFHHLDVRNGLYNPHGKESAASLKFPPSWGTFDVILLKSVFTHLRRAEAENYIRQIPSLLRPGGRCLASFFLLNAEQRRHEAENRIRFRPSSEGAAYAVPEIPEAIVAFEEQDVLEIIAQAGLALERPVVYGTWSGREDGLSHQDILVLTRAQQAA